MADPYDDWLKNQQAPSLGPAPVQSGAQVDEYDRFLEASKPAPQPQPAEGSLQLEPDAYDQYLKSANPNQRSYLDTFTRGVARNWGQFEALSPSLNSLKADLEGDAPSALKYAEEAKAKMAPYGDSDWELNKVNDLETFGYWMSEKLGEQGITALATMGTGGLGGLTMGLVAKNLFMKGAITRATAQKLMMGGAAVPSYALSSAMEAAGTTQELYGATGQAHSELAIPAGLVKGVLELYAPMSIARSIISPGNVLGKSIAGALVKTGLKEGSTEAAQEAIDVYARKQVDPSYSWFGEGGEWWGPGVSRVFEAGATGALVGLVYGAPFAGAEAKHSRAKALGDQPIGDRQIVQAENEGQPSPSPALPPQGEPPPARDSLVGAAPSPLTARGLALPPGHTFDEHTNSMGQTNITIKRGKEQVGRVYVRSLRDLDALQIGNISLDESIQRQGVATAVTNYLEQKFQKPVVPDTLMSDAEYQRWKKISPEAVRGYRPDDSSRTLGGEKFWMGDPRFNNYPMQRKMEILLGEPAGTRTSGKKTENLRLHPSAQNKPIENVLEGQPRGYDSLNTPHRATLEQQQTALGLNPGNNTNVAVGPYTQEDEVPAGQHREAFIAAKAAEDQAMVERGQRVQGEMESETRRLGAIMRRDNFVPIPGGRETKGPVNELEDTVKPVPTSTPRDILPNEVRGQATRDDILQVGALVATLPETNEDWQRMAEAATRRYVEVLPNGKPGTRIMNSTELELHHSMYKTQDTKPKYVEVDQAMLQRVAITAQLTDLNRAVQEGRVWFTPDAKGAAPALLEEFSQMSLEIQSHPELGIARLVGGEAIGRLETAYAAQYSKLLKAGLRVIPSHGAGFFYNGLVDIAGKPFTTPESGRTQEIALYDPVTRFLSPFIDPHDGGLELKLTAIKATDPAMRERVMVVSIDRNKLRAGDLHINPDGTIELTTDLVLGKLTPGIQMNLDDSARGATSVVWAAPGVEVAVKYDPGTELVRYQDLGERMAGWARELKPAIEKILKSVGIDQMPLIHISTAGVDSPGTYFYNGSVIQVSPQHSFEFLHKLDVGDEKADFMVTVFHELGHLITMKYVEKLPVEIGERLQHAWQQAQLARRMGDFSKIAMAGTKGPTVVADNWYWSSPLEWLAEQFRRWAGSDQIAVSEIDKAFKSGARELENYFKQVEQFLGKNWQINMMKPSHQFTLLMDYLKAHGDRKQAALQAVRQMQLLRVAPDVLENPVMLDLGTKVISAIRAMLHMFPENVQAVVNENLNPGIMPGEVLDNSPDAMARFIVGAGQPLSIIEFALAAMQGENLSSRAIISHELMHAYETFGLISKGDIAILMKDIQGKEQQLFNSNARDALWLQIFNFGGARNWTVEQMKAEHTRIVGMELRAHYIQQYADTGLAYSEQGKSIIARLLAVLDAIRQVFTGRTKEDVIKDFFRGEMVNRAAREEANAERLEDHLIKVLNSSKMLAPTMPDLEYPVGDFKVQANYEDGSAQDKLGSRYITYNWRDKDGVIAGTLELKNRMPKGFEIAWIKSDRFNLAHLMLQEAERDLGIKMKLSGELTQAGYVQARMFQKMTRQPGLLDLYTKVDMKNLQTGKAESYWFSPSELVRRKNMAKAMVERVALGEAPDLDPKQIMLMYQTFLKLSQKLPKSVWTDPRLEQMFALKRDNFRDETQGSMLRTGVGASENKLSKSVGMPYGSTKDPVEMIQEAKTKLARGKRARELNMPYETTAPPTMLTYNINKTIRDAYEKGLPGNILGTQFGASAAANRELKNQLHEMDRIGWFTKKWWSLSQMVWRNEHITEARDYEQNVELMKQMAGEWLKRANDTAEAWEGITEPAQRDAIAQVLFRLTNQEYRTPAEVKAKSTRLPTGWQDLIQQRPLVPGTEVHTMFTAAGLKAESAAIIGRVARDFADFLTAVENVRNEILVRTHGVGTATYNVAKAALDKEMAELRGKPYFPMVRFGEFTVAVRQGRKVVYANAFMTQSQRDAEVIHLRRQFPTGQINISRVDPRAAEFMSLPGPLLRAIKEKLPIDTGMDPVTKAKTEAWIEEFEHLNAPDRTFAKRWMPSRQLPGYSMDAFRAYSHYFTYGSRYLARLAYTDPLQSAVNAVTASVDTVGNGAKRAAIATYMANHFKYIMEGGNDSGKFRAITSLYFLGFSPAAAAINLSQVPLITIPSLSAHFGKAKAYAALNQGIKALKGTMGYATGDPMFERARLEATEQGYLEVGQAASLAGFAEGHNLHQLLSGTKAQHFWRNLQWYGMKMFSATEHYNREFTFKISYDLAIQNPSTQRLRDLDRLYPLEVANLQSKANLSHQAAVAFLFAKEMIKRTQFEFSKDTDPPFMRPKYAKDVLIFFKYTHSMLYAMRFNGATTQMLLMMAVMFGLQGLPGSDDLNELISLFGKKLFGADWDVHRHARKFVRDITRGTVFDEVGPDLFMHGISRYGGLGLGLLPDHWGAPRFDASANGSMGRLVPGLAEFMHGMNTDAKYKDLFADTAQKASGAGYGQLLTLVQFAMDPTAPDSHKWEQLLPRFARGFAKAYRYGVDPQAETTRAGAKIVKFSWGDPDDITTILSQALGFTPTKVAETWDVIREVKEVMQVYQARRTTLYAQMDKAITAQNPQAIDSVLDAIKAYNDQVVLLDPTMAIKANALVNSIRQKNQGRALMEDHLAGSRREIPITDRVRDMWPGLKTIPVK